ncbi:MAG: molybdopterin cofactor-binding domain-containing protein [Alphaproteobacteria bacterium]
MASNASLDKAPNVDDWLAIDTDGRVRVRTGKVDIGQRVSTALGLIAAEELDAPLDSVDVLRADTDRAPDEGITSGSNSMEESGNAVRLATATARRHMLARAAELLDVDPATLEIEDGLIQSRATNRTLTFAELQGGRPFGIAIDLGIASKPAAQYRLVGRPAAARGMAEIVSGKFQFLQDMELPGMLHARVVRPPHYHATLRGLDDAVPRRLESEEIRVIRDGSFLAVAGADEYAVIRAATRLFNAADWDRGAGLEPQDIFERLRGNERTSLPVVDGTPQDAPLPPATEPPANAAVTLSARYERPYHMHASIAPSAGAALWRDGELTVWSHSQGIYILRAAMAGALNLPETAIHIHHVPGAGCYGHNGADDAAFDAVLAARAIPGVPVLLKWTREDENAWEPYGSCMAMDLSASLDNSGAVIAWAQETHSDTHSMRPRPGAGGAGPARLLATRYLADAIQPYAPQPNMQTHGGIHRNMDPLYDLPNKRLVKHLVRDMPLRTSSMRTLGAFANIFAIESFMDELAEAAGIDPLEFRLRHLGNPRARDVLNAMAAKLGNAPLPEGQGRGFAFSQYKNVKTYAAVGIELEVTDAAEIVLKRAVVAADAGQIVDPDGLTAQLEGGLLQSASWALYESVEFDRDGITSRDWDSYPILRFGNVPVIETVLIDRPGEPFLGAGEATSGPIAGAIANAVRNASGLRLRRMPFTPDALRAAAMGNHE